LRRFVTENFPDGAPKSTRTADWKKSLPPGVDVKAYFAGEKGAATREIGEEQAPTPASSACVEQEILSGPCPSFLDFPALRKKLKAAATAAAPDESWPFSYDPFYEPLSDPLTWMTFYSVLSAEQCFSRALRAVARHEHRKRSAELGSVEVSTEDYKIQVWLKHWIMEGGGIPKDIPVRYLSVLEEEACLAFETDGERWSGFPTWKRYNLLPSKPSGLKPATLTEAPDIQPPLTWIVPQPRKIDRILVDAGAETSAG
jgi:hypothetical protein